MAFESGLNQVVNFIVEIGDQESAAFAASFEVILNALLRPIPLSATRGRANEPCVGFPVYLAEQTFDLLSKCGLMRTKMNPEMRFYV